MYKQPKNDGEWLTVCYYQSKLQREMAKCSFCQHRCPEVIMVNLLRGNLEKAHNGSKQLFSLYITTSIISKQSGSIWHHYQKVMEELEKERREAAARVIGKSALGSLRRLVKQQGMKNKVYQPILSDLNTGYEMRLYKLRAEGVLNTSKHRHRNHMLPSIDSPEFSPSPITGPKSKQFSRPAIPLLTLPQQNNELDGQELSQIKSRSQTLDASSMLNLSSFINKTSHMIDQVKPEESIMILQTLMPEVEPVNRLKQLSNDKPELILNVELANIVAPSSNSLKSSQINKNKMSVECSASKARPFSKYQNNSTKQLPLGLADIISKSGHQAIPGPPCGSLTCQPNKISHSSDSQNCKKSNQTPKSAAIITAHNLIIQKPTNSNRRDLLAHKPKEKFKEISSLSNLQSNRLAITSGQDIKSPAKGFTQVKVPSNKSTSKKGFMLDSTLEVSVRHPFVDFRPVSNSVRRQKQSSRGNTKSSLSPARDSADLFGRFRHNTKMFETPKNSLVRPSAELVYWSELSKAVDTSARDAVSRFWKTSQKIRRKKEVIPDRLQNDKIAMVSNNKMVTNKTPHKFFGHKRQGFLSGSIDMIGSDQKTRPIYSGRHIKS